MERSPLLPQHKAAGARLVDRPEAPGHTTVLTFGDVPAEVRAGSETAVLLDASDRGAVRVSGADAASFLQRILANEVRSLDPGQGNRNLLLTSKGKVRFEFDLAREAEAYELTTPPGQAALIVQAIDEYLFADEVSLADHTSKTAPLELIGPQARALAAEVLGTAPPVAQREFLDLDWRGGRVRVTPMAIAGLSGVRIDPGPEAVAEVWSTLRDAGGRPAGVVARDFLRVETGAALFGVDVDDGIYPQEAGLDDAFSLEKGCFIGQEVVAKIDTYGGLNKRLLALRVSHDDPIASGTRLHSLDDEARDLGVVTSWGYSFTLDSGLVLGYVKRRHQETGTRFRLGDSAATATIVEPPRG